MGGSTICKIMDRRWNVDMFAISISFPSTLRIVVVVGKKPDLSITARAASNTHVMQGGFFFAKKVKY